MANTTEATYSFTTKVNGDLLTIRGNTKDEFALNLASLHDDLAVIEMINTLQQKFKPTSVAEIQAAFNGTIIPDPLSTSASSTSTCSPRANVDANERVAIPLCRYS